MIPTKFSARSGGNDSCRVGKIARRVLCCAARPCAILPTRSLRLGRRVGKRARAPSEIERPRLAPVAHPTMDAMLYEIPNNPETHMRANDGTRTAAEVLIDQLVIHGVQHVFCVPGEELHRRARCVSRSATSPSPSAGRRAGRRSWRKPTARRLDGRASASSRAGRAPPTRRLACTSPSRTSTPMILFVGQIGREMREREAFQELDYRAVFGTIREMGDRDRRSRAHSRADLARLLPPRPAAGPARS